MQNNLWSPKSYRDATDEQRANVCNGCGPSGWKAHLIPETVWGLSISAACNIHDWMYSEGGKESDRVFADRMFLINMQRLVDSKSKLKVLRWLRHRRIKKYFFAVKEWGGNYFSYRRVYDKNPAGSFF